LEDDDTPDRTPPLHRTLPPPALALDCAGPTLRYQPSNRRHMARALRARGALGAPGGAARPPPRSPPPRSRHRRRAVGGQAPASAWGPADDLPLRGSAPPCPGVAGCQPPRCALAPSRAVSAHAAPAPAATASRAREPTPTRVLYWAGAPGSPPDRGRPSPSARASARRMACRGPCAPSTARPWPRRPAGASRRGGSGGASAASGTRGWSRDGLRSTAVLHASPRRARRQPPARRRGTRSLSRPEAPAAARRTTTRAPTRRGARAPRRRSRARRPAGGRPRARSPRLRGLTGGGVAGTPARSAASVARAS
jgi:hypothetical protein